MAENRKGLDYKMEEIGYVEKEQDIAYPDRISITLYNRKKRISLVLTQEEYDSNFIKIRPSLPKWNVSEEGILELRKRLVNKFLSNEEVRSLRKYVKKISPEATNRRSIRQFYSLDYLVNIPLKRSK